MSMELKSIKGWEKSEAASWGEYCKPGELVGEDVFDYFLNVLPPESLKKGYLQVGEPHGSRLNPRTGKYQSTYLTFVSAGEKGVYRYCGASFPGGTVSADIYKKFRSVNEYLKVTYVLVCDEYVIRPRVVCKDGFELSIQAGNFFYSCPAVTRTDVEYTACEVGCPSVKEELLMPYIESDKDDPTTAVYPYTPVDIIQKVVEKHGGYFEIRF